MSDEATSVVDEPKSPEPKAPESDVEKQAFLDRLSKESGKRKEAEKLAAQMAKDMADLRAQMEERDNAGLPELERERKRAEQLEKRATEAEKKAEEASREVLRSQRERWVQAAASSHNFADPSDASAFLNLDDIEDEKDAERAVKRLAGQKQHLLKSEDPQLPGRVLKDGKSTGNVPQDAAQNMSAEAQFVSDALAQFRKSRQ